VQKRMVFEVSKEIPPYLLKSVSIRRERGRKF